MINAQIKINAVNRQGIINIAQTLSARHDRCHLCGE
jgi:hypothetical protein